MKNIYLVGFMATGKTAVAKVLSRRLGLRLVDMDEVIQEKEGISIGEIFRAKGEPYFRRLEREMIDDLAAQTDCVVACGGGVFADQGNIDRMKQSGTVVCLTSTPQTIRKRSSVTKARPLLDVAHPLEKIRELLEQRRPFYAQAHHTLDCDALSVAESAQAVLDIFKNKPV